MKQLIFILTTFLIFSCKKETVNDRTPELLTRSWKMTARDVITSLQGTPLEGHSSNWYAPGGCNSELLWTFQSSGNLIITEDPSCVPSGSTGIFNSIWTLTNNNKEINISGSPFGSFTYNIISLTPTKLVVQRNENVGFGSEIINLIIQTKFTAQ